MLEDVFNRVVFCRTINYMRLQKSRIGNNFKMTDNLKHELKIPYQLNVEQAILQKFKYYVLCFRDLHTALTFSE